MIVANPRTEYVEKIMPRLFELSFLQFEFTFLDFNKVYEDTFDRVPLSSLRYDWFVNHVSHSRSLVYDVGSEPSTLSVVSYSVLSSSPCYRSCT